MTQRILIPVEDNNGINSRIAQHFGQAPYFALVEVTGRGQIAKVEIEKNTNEHMGGTAHPHESIIFLRPSVIIAGGMGQGALFSFVEAGILVLKANGDTINDVMARFFESKLAPLSGGCSHAGHHCH
jgi:predicted Fe-Mo cluster-binding NifX family protein